MKRADTDTTAGLDQQKVMTYAASWQLLEEDVDDNWSSGHTTDRRFQSIWGTRYIDDIVMRREDTDDDGTYDNTYYHLTDVQFSTVAIIDETAEIQERVSYDPYGKARHHYMGDVNGDGAITTSGAGSDYQTIIDIATGGNNQIGDSGTNSYRAEADLDRDGDASDRVYVLTAKPALPSGALSAIDNVIGWDGYIFNAETKLYHVRWRWYSPELGRWVEWDPLRYVDGMNLSEYVSSAPIDWYDPLGLGRLLKPPPQVPTVPSGPAQKSENGPPCDKDCPPGEEKTVIIQGDIHGIYRRPWEVVCDNYAKDANAAGDNVVYYVQPTKDQLRDIIQDPCTQTLIIVGHSAQGSFDDNFPGVYMKEDAEFLSPDEVKYWLKDCVGPTNVTIRSCYQGVPENLMEWEDAFNLPKGGVWGSPKGDRFWYFWRNYSDCKIKPKIKKKVKKKAPPPITPNIPKP